MSLLRSVCVHTAHACMNACQPITPRKRDSMWHTLMLLKLPSPGTNPCPHTLYSHSQLIHEWFRIVLGWYTTQGCHEGAEGECITPQTAHVQLSPMRNCALCLWSTVRTCDHRTCILGLTNPGPDKAAWHWAWEVVHQEGGWCAGGVFKLLRCITPIWRITSLWHITRCSPHQPHHPLDTTGPT